MSEFPHSKPRKQEHRQEHRLGGLGLRCQADISPLAYIDALEQSLPHFGGGNGVCQPLAHLVDRDGDVSTRWRPLLESGCRTGNELARAWGHLQTEARECCQYLGEELTGSMSHPAEGIGKGVEDGSTRALMTKER